MASRTLASALLAAGILTAGIPVTLAHAEATPPVNITFRGDSMTSGVGSFNIPPGVVNGRPVGSILVNRAGIEPGTQDGCYRTDAAYPAVIGQDLQISATNFACAGITTDQFESGAYGEPSQLSRLGSDTQAVVLTLGGNDIKFAKIVACMTFGECSADPLIDEARQALKTLPNDLVRILGEIRAAAPNAWIVIMGYAPEFSNPGPLGPGCLGLISDAERAVANELQQGLNTAWRTAIAQFHVDSGTKVKFIEPGGVFTPPPGYESVAMTFDACSTEPGHMMNGILSSDNPGGDPFHLNRLGHWAFAQYVRQFLVQVGLLKG